MANLAVALHSDGKTKQAIELYRLALEGKSGHVYCIFQTACTNVRVYPSTVKSPKKSISLDGTNANKSYPTASLFVDREILA